MKYRSLATRGPRQGFTLLEILIVVGLIAVLAGALMAGLFGGGEAGNVSITRIFVTQSVNVPLQAYKSQKGSYPSTEEGLEALVPYLDSAQAIIDPWNNPYRYQFPSKHGQSRPDVWSAGPDGQDGTEDDIQNWGN